MRGSNVPQYHVSNAIFTFQHNYGILRLSFTGYRAWAPKHEHTIAKHCAMMWVITETT